MKAAISIGLLFLSAILFAFAVYRWSEEGRLAKSEPNAIRVWVSGETQKLLFYEHKDKPLVFHVINSNKVESQSEISYYPAYQPQTVTIPNPGGISAGFKLQVEYPSAPGQIKDQYVVKSGMRCFELEYRVPDNDQFEPGTYLHYSKNCQKK